MTKYSREDIKRICQEEVQSLSDSNSQISGTIENVAIIVQQLIRP